MSTTTEQLSDLIAGQIDELIEEQSGIEGEIEHLNYRIGDIADRIAALRKRQRALEQMDESEVETLIEHTPVPKTPRMKELESMIYRGMDWNQWAAINREYQREAERAKTDVLDLLDLELAS